MWDYENRLTSASTRKQTVRYRYDALGRRVQRYFVGGKENTKFIYDGQDVLVDDNNGTLTKYQNGLGVDNKLKMTTNGTAKYFLADHLGSTSGLADASGNLTEQTSYDSFGNATNNLSTRYQFTGREFDNFTGLHYYRARWYDGNLGRFISEDPIGLAGGINQFAYSENNSVNRTDPSGLYSDGREEAIAAIVTEATRIVTIPGVGQIILAGTAGFALGYAIGYGPGQLSARLFYPEQFPETQTQPETCPTKPKPQPAPTPTPPKRSVTFYHYTDKPIPNPAGGLWVGSSATTTGGYYSETASYALGIPEPTLVYPITIDPTETPFTEDIVEPNKYGRGGGIDIYFPLGTPPGSIGLPRPVPRANP